jgi:bis(5'-nucleosyl)-tetraphosphatase (symmetrical)
MAVYAIGDIQGCYDQLRHLLDLIRFDPGKDKLWLAGDLVNRGPDSLKVLRFVKGLGSRAITVLGNHDLHLLAMSQDVDKHKDPRHTLDQVLAAPDRDELLHWLRHRPLIHRSKKRGFSMVHAGLPPQWDLTTALECAAELEAILQGDGFHDYCQQMYGNLPDRWDPALQGMERLRFITNCFTRLRFCNPDGSLSLKESGAPGTQDPTLTPWYAIPGRASAHDRILFGHWSTLGYGHHHNTWSLDSGCLWGGALSALRIRKKKPPKLYQLDCPRTLQPTRHHA